MDRDLSSGYRLGPGLPVVKGVYPTMQCGYFTIWLRDVQIRVTRNSAEADAAGLFASPEIFSAEKQVIMPSSSLQLVCHEVMFID